MSRVFFSYRHEDTEADAGRLYDTLASELGEKALYKDVENIALGRNWKRAIREALADSAAVLIVMGPDWCLTPAIELEFKLILGGDVPVVPILVRGADIVQLTKGLPASLSEISERKAVSLEHASWARDCRELIETLKLVLADPGRARVIIEPPVPQILLDGANWPAVQDRDRLLDYAQDLAECLNDPDLRKRAEDSYDRFSEESFNEYRRRHNIPSALLDAVRIGLQRLSAEQYVLKLLDSFPPERDWEGLATLASHLEELLDDPSIGERAWEEFNDIKEEISELHRSKGDSGSPEMIRLSQANLNRIVRAAKARLVEEFPGIDKPGATLRYPEFVWPAKAFGSTREYGR